MDDCGGAFAMGATMGSLFHFWKGYRNSPAVSYSYTSTHTYAHNLITHILKIPAYKKQAFKVNITQMIYIYFPYTPAVCVVYIIVRCA